MKRLFGSISRFCLTTCLYTYRVSVRLIDYCHSNPFNHRWTRKSRENVSIDTFSSDPSREYKGQPVVAAIGVPELFTRGIVRSLDTTTQSPGPHSV